MKKTFSMLAVVMLFEMNVWAVYGIGLEARGTGCDDCSTVSELLSSASTLSFQSPLPATPTPSPTLSNTLSTSPPTTLPNNQHTPSAPALTTPAVLGISISLSLAVLIILFLIFGTPPLRRWKRSRALKRAVDEVERGIEMRKDVSAATESKENMVLESRVEIVVGEEESVRDVVEAWDGWNATWSGDDDVEEERGRKGMSLPRREY